MSVLQGSGKGRTGVWSSKNMKLATRIKLRLCRIFMGLGKRNFAYKHFKKEASQIDYEEMKKIIDTLTGKE